MKKCNIALFLMICLCLSACGTTNWIHVDQNNVPGPWNGTSKNPYKTITAAISNTKDGESNKIVVHKGVYKEAFTLKKGVHLMTYKNNKSVVLDGSGATDIIMLRGGNEVEGFIFKNATTGINIRFDKTSCVEPPFQVRTMVSDCRFETLKGIEVSEFGPISLSSGSKANTAIWIFDNWFYDTNYAVKIDVKSPLTGHLDLELLLAQNLIRGKGSTGDGIYINATQKGGGSLKLAGWINNNLVFHASNGIHISADKGGEAALEIYGNTIADNTQNGVSVQATGGSSIKADIINNIIVNNGMHGFSESSPDAKPAIISHNLFYKNNGGNYKPHGSSSVEVPSGSNNLNGNPQFKSGTFYWNELPTSSGVKEGSYFLNQSGSPAVNTGTSTSTKPNIYLFYDGTTSVSQTADKGQRDRGFHYYYRK